MSTKTPRRPDIPTPEFGVETLNPIRPTTDCFVTGYMGFAGERGRPVFRTFKQAKEHQKAQTKRSFSLPEGALDYPADEKFPTHDCFNGNMR